MDKRKVIYYEDELNDEFSTAEITPRKIDKNFKYVHSSLFKRFTRFFWYRIIATPVAFFYLKIVHGHRIVGREKLKPYKKQGYFLYANHTHHLCDATVPTFVAMPKSAYLIVHPNNVSIRGIGNVAVSLGAIPLPDDRAAYRNFSTTIERRIAEHCAVTIYPEAHIWPYYTKIRPFKETSFRFPCKLGVAAFSFTNTYQKRKHRKTPRVITYVDGPFFPDEGASRGESEKNLRDKIYSKMCERAELSNVEIIKYVKKGENNG